MRSGTAVLRLLVLIVTFAISSVSLARANSIWFVKPGGAGAQTGVNWANAFATVEQAIAASSPTVDVLGQPDQVWVAEGVYIPGSGVPYVGFVINKPLKLYGSFKGTENSVQSRLGVARLTILDGDIGVPGLNNDNAAHVVDIQSAGAVVIDGFQIRNGWGVNLTGAVNGVGISSVATDLDLVNCYVHSNGIQPVGPFGNLGGGLYFTGGAATNSTLHIKGCTFLNNYGTKGGGIFCDDKVTGQVVNTQILENFGESGGGGACLDGMGITSGSPRLDFTNCVFWGNRDGPTSGSGGTGGGLALLTDAVSGLGGNVRIVNCTFSDNSTAYSSSGQAMSISTNSQAVIHNSIFYWNNTNGPSGPSPIVGAATIAYSDVEYGWTGSTNFSADPKFVDHASGVLTLLLNSSPPSPCLDAADYGQLPSDALDVDGDGDTSEIIPFDVVKQTRPKDQTTVTDTGVGSYTYLDMGAYELH